MNYDDIERIKSDYYDEAFTRFCDVCELNSKSKHVQTIFYALYEYGGFAECGVEFSDLEYACLANDDDKIIELWRDQ